MVPLELIRELEQQHPLSEEERALLLRSQANSIDAAVSVFERSIELNQRKLTQSELESRRSIVMALAYELGGRDLVAYEGSEIPFLRGSGAAPPFLDVLEAPDADEFLALMGEATPNSFRLDAADQVNLISDELLTEWVPPDQGRRNTCVAFAMGACIELMRNLAGEELVDLSSQYLYWQMRKLPVGEDPPPGWKQGATKLGHAMKVLQDTGVCEWDYLPYYSPLQRGMRLEGPAPDDNAHASAGNYKVAEFEYEDYPKHQCRPKHGVAQMIYEQLAQRRPVAIAVPLFPASPDTFINNWRTSRASKFGRVPNPVEGSMVRDGKVVMGHAVCVTGFEPDKEEPTGGYFIFRNSWSGNWAKHHSLWPGLPKLPRSGYGAISATYVEKYCWEWCAPISF